MANDITVTNNTSTNIWEAKYTVDAAGTKEKTLATAGTFLDRNIKVAVTTPAGNASVSGGGLSSTNYSVTPTVDITISSQTTTGINVTNTQPGNGYYVTLSGTSTSASGTTTVSRSDITLTKTAGYITAGTTAITSTSVSPSVTVGSGSKTKYLTLPTAIFAVSGNNIYTSAAGWVPAGSAGSPIGTISAGALSATTTNVTSGTAAIHSNGNFATSTTAISTYYVQLATTAGSVKPVASVTTSGYVTSAQNVTGGATSVNVTGNGDKLYIAEGTLTGSVMYLSSGVVDINTTVDGMETTNGVTPYSITIDSTVTCGSVQGKAENGNTTGIIAANEMDLSEPSEIFPTVNGETTIYIPAATHTLTGGGLTAAAGSASLSASSGYYNGSSYDTTDKINLSTTQTSGYYKLVASGYGKVTRAAVSSTVTSGYTDADTSSISASTGTSNTATTNYFIKKSTLSASSVNSSSTAQTVTISSGYYPSDRTVTVNAMTTQTPTTNYSNTGMSTYFNAGSSSDYTVSITPNYSNSAGYVSAHTSTNNGGIGYWKIKTTSLTQGTTTVANNVATRGSASIASSGWINSTSIPAATFSNVATSGTTYVNISNTPDAPILDAEGNLYINKGYVDNLQISLARLIPDDANVASSATMLQGTTAYDKNGKLWTGTIATFTPSTKYYATTSDQTLSTNGKYVSGNIVISKLTSSNYTAANIRKGATISVNNGSSNVYSVAGTFTSASTVSSGQIAASASQILSGYSAWVDGAEVKGNIAAKTTANITESFTATSGLVNIPAGFYAEDSSFILTNGDYNADSSTSANSTVTPSVTISSASTYGFTSSSLTGTYVTIDPGASATAWSVTPRANITTSGYIPTGSKTGTAVTNTPSIEAGTNWYVPVVTPQFKGGNYTTTNTNVVTTAPTVTIGSTGTFVGNGSTYGITTTAPTGTDGTNYLTISDVVTSTTGSAKSTWQATKAANTYSATYKGVVNITSGTTAIATSTASGTSSVTITPTVTNNFVTYYVPIVTPSFNDGAYTTNTDTNTVTNPSVTVNGTGSLITSASTYGVTTAAIAGTEGTNFVTFDATTTATNGTAVSNWRVTKAAITYGGAYKGLINTTAGDTAIASTTATGTSSTAIVPTVIDNFSKYYMPIVTPTIAGGAPSVNISSNTVTSANMTTATTGTYYITMTAKGTGSRGAITYSNSAGAIIAHSSASGLNAATSTEGSKAGTVYVPTATKTLSLNSNVDGTAAMGVTGFTPASSGSYYITLTTTAGSVVPKLVTTSGYTPAETTTGSSTSVGVTGNGAQIFIPTNTITGSVVNLSSGSVAVSKAVTGMATSTAATSYYITVDATVTNGSVKGKATAGNTTGIVAAGATNTSNASTITPGVSGTGTIYIPAGAYSVSGGGLTSGTGYASLASTGVTLTTAATEGYYKLTASGYGTVNRAAITKQVTTSGYMPADTASNYSNSTSLNSNTGTKDYYIKNSTLSATSVNSSTSQQTVTITSGYYPSNRTVTITAMGTGSVTPGFNQANITTYFDSASSTGSISITPKYTNTAGYIAAHTNTTGTTSYYNIKTASLIQGTTTVSGTTATRGSATIANSGWIQSGEIPAATFANTATSGVTYVDISNTTDAPILASSGYLYINKGYTDNLQISLAHLIPDNANVSASNQMLNGVTAYDSSGKLWTGNIASMAGGTKYATTSDQTISTSGKYLTSNIVIKKLTSSNYSAANIKKGVTITVGNSSANVYSVTGTFTSAGTQTTGTLAAAGQILSGYTAWANGAEVNGSIVTRTSADLSVNGSTVSVASGYYASNVSTSIGAGAYTAAASQVTSGTITPSVSISSASTYGFTTTQPSAGTYLTVDPGASVTTKWKARATATITTSGYLSTGSTTGDYEGTPGIAAGTNYYVPVVTPTITAGTVTPTISNAITVSGMDTTTAATSYYIDAAASGSYTVTSAKYTNTAGVIAAHTNTVVNTGSSGTIANTTASRVYIPAAGINSTGSITNVTTTVAPGTVSIANNTAAVSGKTRIGVTPATTTGSISTYYIALQASAAANGTGVTSAISGTSTASINSAGYAPTTLTTSVALSGSVTAKTSKKDSSVYYVPIPTATFTADGASIKCSTAGWIAANGVVGTIGNGTLKATTAALTSGSAAMTATTNMVTSTTTGTNFGTYYVTLTTTAGSVTPQAGVQTAGYVTTTTTANGTAVSVPVTGNSSKVYIQAGAYSADKSTSTNSTVTPSVAVNNATIYGFTTTKPSGTNGTNYLTIDPGATATNWSVTPRANITRAGYIAAGSGTGTAVSGTPTIAAGTNYYVPIVSPTFSGGDVTAQLDLSTSSFETNMVTTTAASDYYVRVITSGTFTRDAVTYNNAAGVISATTGGVAITATIDGYIDQASATIRIPQATMSVTGTNTVSPSVSMTTSNVILNDTNNGIAVTATGGGTAAVTAVAATNQAGYAPAGVESLGSATLNAASRTTSTTKYIAGVTLIPPASGTRTFSLTIPNGSTSNFMTFVFTTDSSGNVTVDEG